MMKKLYFTILLHFVAIFSYAQFTKSNSTTVLQSTVNSFEIGIPYGVNALSAEKDQAIKSPGVFATFSHNSKIIGKNNLSLGLYGSLGMQVNSLSIDGSSRVGSEFGYTSVEYFMGPSLTVLADKYVIVTYVNYGISYHFDKVFQASNYFAFRQFTGSIGIKVANPKFVVGLSYLPEFEQYVEVVSNYYRYVQSIGVVRLSVGLRI